MRTVTMSPGDCRAYLTSAEGREVLRSRLPSDARVTGLPYGERSLHQWRAGDSSIPPGTSSAPPRSGSSIGGEVWVVSGDYKTDPDPTTTPFETVRCHTFVTESTFGLPIYRWPPQAEVLGDINAWWRANQAAGKASLLYGYALGKAQRLLAGLDPDIGPIYTHGAVERMTSVYRAAGVRTAADHPRRSRRIDDTDWSRAIVVAPPSADGSTWTRRFGHHATGFASGWMLVRGARRGRSLDRGFALSDHVDWPSLLATVEATGAERVWVTHGFTAPVVRWLRERGLDAQVVQTRFEGDVDDEAARPEEAPA